MVLFEDYSVLTLMSIIFLSVNVILFFYNLFMKVLKKKLLPKEEDYLRMENKLRYAMLDPIEMDDEILDNDLMKELDDEAGIGKYDEPSVIKKKKRQWYKKNRDKHDIVSRKFQSVKVIRIIEFLVNIAVKLGTTIILVTAFFTVANAEPTFIHRLHNVGYYVESCTEAAARRICNLTTVGNRWLYTFHGYETGHYQNCRIGGDEAEILHENCVKDNFCISELINERCDDWCFGGYTTYNFVKLNVTKSIVTLYSGFNCGTAKKSHDLSCPYGFIEHKGNYYCLNNNGHVSERMILLDNEDDIRALKEFNAPAITTCAASMKTTFKDTIEHINPNDCKVYSYKANPGDDTQTCGNLPTIPVNTTHVVVYCDKYCLDYSDKLEYPCNQVVPMNSLSFVGCHYNLKGVNVYDPRTCGDYETGNTEVEPSKVKKTTMTSYKKLPRYLWLSALAVFEIVSTLILIKAF